MIIDCDDNKLDQLFVHIHDNRYSYSCNIHSTSISNIFSHNYKNMILNLCFSDVNLNVGLSREHSVIADPTHPIS